MEKQIKVVLVTAFVVPVLALGQTGSTDQNLTAREMFMAARAKAIKKEAATSGVASRAKPSTSEPVPVTPVSATPEPAIPEPVRATPAVERAQAIPVGYSPTPIGLRYTLIKVSGDRNENVSADTVFHSGDHMKISVDVSESGYLYIITQGSSGTWETLFPSAAVENGDNHVLAGRSYIVPPGSVVTFVGQPGTEKLFVIFSRQPEPEMDRLIYTLREGTNQPAARPPEPKAPSPTFLLSSNKIDDQIVDKLRDVYARDLIIEKAETADQAKPASQQDKSVYVVNRDGGRDARVVADIRLNHQ